MKKILIGCLIALTMGNLTGCTNEKVNNETNETNTTTNEVSETQEINEINTTTEENTENQETNETEEYQPEFVTVNYNNEGIYQYKIIKCNQNKAEELKEYGKSFKENTNVTLTFANGSKFEGLEHKYGQNGEYCYIRIINGDKIETYDVLGINPIESLEEEYEPEYKERHFTIDNIETHTVSTIKVIRCTDKETEYIEKTKSETYDRLIVTDEVDYHFQGMYGFYGEDGKESYIKLFIGNDQYYFKVIE